MIREAHSIVRHWRPLEPAGLLLRALRSEGLSLWCAATTAFAVYLRVRGLLADALMAAAAWRLLA